MRMRAAARSLWCSVALTAPVLGLSVTSLVQRASALPWSCAGELDGFAFDSAYAKDGQPRGWSNWLVDGRLMLGQYPHCQPAEPGPSASLEYLAHAWSDYIKMKNLGSLSINRDSIQLLIYQI